MATRTRTYVFETFNRSNGTDEIWTEAAKLFSENYAVWGPGSGRKAGERVKASKQRLVTTYLPDDRSTYTRVLVNGNLAGQAFASRWDWEWEGEHQGDRTCRTGRTGRTVICWITQLVVHPEYRRRGLAGRILQELREEGDEVFGIMSSHPGACKAAANAFGKSIEKVDLSFVREHAGSVMDGSPVGYVRNAVPRGIIFDGDDSSGLVCGADSEFFVDRTEPLKVLESVRRDFWPLGELPAGHEFLLLLRPARRWDHRTET